ncbi:hypothetical protein [Paraburkholderia sp. RL17-373-BIF-A]|uniref:hypothetical protein n=1 Tax=Paraburkholderia sp. RL17-373-BIF-A TaxID=3031629 RepID=UPI0038B8A611
MTALFFVRRAAGRVARAIGLHPKREPVRPATERDFAHTCLLLGFTAGACAMAIGFSFVLTFSGRFLCN